MEQNKDAKPARVAVPLTAEELDKIDAWGFARRIRNRSDAIKALIQHGLKAAAEVPV
jgi:hypothetical protein